MGGFTDLGKEFPVESMLIVFIIIGVMVGLFDKDTGLTIMTLGFVGFLFDILIRVAINVISSDFL